MRKTFLRHGLFALVLAGFALAGVAGANALSTDEPAAPGHGSAPIPGSDTLEARAPDPGGGVPWVVRVYQGRTGRTCTQLGREVGGKVGHPREDGGFNELRLEEGGGCTDLLDGPVGVALTSYSDVPVTREVEPERAIVHGVAAPRVAKIAVTGPGGVRELTPTARGAFVTVYAGKLGLSDIEIKAVFADGSTEVVG